MLNTKITLRRNNKCYYGPLNYILKGDNEVEDQNRKLLKEANKTCLETALDLGLDTEEGQKAYQLAMTGYDRDAKLTEIDVKENDLKAQAEQKEKDSKRNVIIKSIEIGSMVLLTPVVEYVTKKGFAKLMCNFEKDYTFTTTAGRSLSSLFRFKR